MLIQLCYTSRANFQPTAAGSGVEPTVARILQASRRNNSRVGLGGVLYYRDSCFFQVLEGPEREIQALLIKLRQDDRHTDLKVLSTGRITEREFDKWSMKYTHLDETVNAWLQSKGIKTFDPLAFDAPLAHEFSGVLRSSSEAPEPQGQTGTVPSTQGRSLQRVCLTLVVTLAALAAALWYVFS